VTPTFLKMFGRVFPIYKQNDLTEPVLLDRSEEQCRMRLSPEQVSEAEAEIDQLMDRLALALDESLGSSHAAHV